ncbi:hypothetical protein OSB04_010480 [Centaurea solstitialis]|uniref:Uncharacterized protein n=1 Tax=Centaurea solstitialis TaxID=347529 RepID=A0AA38TIF9_9ASTR|nr:hypothetical protein OSB04_010480 [Centaurea solstitialis]
MVCRFLPNQVLKIEFGGYVGRHHCTILVVINKIHWLIYYTSVVMSAAVARGHGGDAGGDPPPHPNKVPTRCEATSKPKKKRGMSTSKNLDVAFRANGDKPLPVEFDVTDKTFKPIGPGNNAALFTRYLENLIGHGTSPYHRSWNNVSPEFRMSIIRRLRRYFILDSTVPEWPMILAGIERQCQDLYKNRKSKLKDYFEKVGGEKDVANARRNRPPHLDDEQWDNTIDLFLDAKFKQHSKTNSQNRSHSRYPTLQGSSSYAASRYKKEAMLAERTSQTQQDGSASSSSVNEKEIITKVLGESRGHNRGIERKLKSSAYSSFFEPPPPPSPLPPPPPMNDGRTVDAFKTLNKYMHDMYKAFTTFQPDFQFPPPPTIDIQALFGSAVAGYQPQQPKSQPQPQPQPQQPQPQLLQQPRPQPVQHSRSQPPHQPQPQLVQQPDRSRCSTPDRSPRRSPDHSSDSSRRNSSDSSRRKNPDRSPTAASITVPTTADATAPIAASTAAPITAPTSADAAAPIATPTASPIAAIERGRRYRLR